MFNKLHNITDVLNLFGFNINDIYFEVGNMDGELC